MSAWSRPRAALGLPMWTFGVSHTLSPGSRVPWVTRSRRRTTVSAGWGVASMTGPTTAWEPSPERPYLPGRSEARSRVSVIPPAAVACTVSRGSVGSGLPGDAFSAASLANRPAATEAAPAAMATVTAAAVALTVRTRSVSRGSPLSASGSRGLGMTYPCAGGAFVSGGACDSAAPGRVGGAGCAPRRAGTSGAPPWGPTPALSRGQTSRAAGWFGTAESVRPGRASLRREGGEHRCGGKELPPGAARPNPARRSGQGGTSSLPYPRCPYPLSRSPASSTCSRVSSVGDSPGTEEAVSQTRHIHSSWAVRS